MSQLDRSSGLVGNAALKYPVRAATTANITLSGEQTIDGIACVADDRVLVKNQSTGSENGIWVVATGSWNRSDDFDGSYDCTTGTMVRCVSGTTNANSVWKLDTTGTITIGTTSLTFTAASVGFDAQGMADFIHAATTKATPIDADEFGYWDSVASLFKKLTFANLKTTLGLTFAALAGSASQAFSALAVNTGLTSVASAATPDIFAASTGQYIYYTGTATCTGFVAAPHAGVFRKLICADACSFTASANLQIEGIPSGTTITLGNSALIEIWASSTTQFKMIYSLSGTFTATGTGFTVNPTTTAKYSVCNGVAYLSIPAKALTGTSNATTFTITGLPASLVPVTKKSFGTLDAADNGGGNYAHATIAAGSNVISLWVTHETNPWTAANTKFLATSEFTYSLA